MKSAKVAEESGEIRRIRCGGRSATRSSPSSSTGSAKCRDLPARPTSRRLAAAAAADALPRHRLLPRARPLHCPAAAAVASAAAAAAGGGCDPARY